MKRYQVPSPEMSWDNFNCRRHIGMTSVSTSDSVCMSLCGVFGSRLSVVPADNNTSMSYRLMKSINKCEHVQPSLLRSSTLRRLSRLSYSNFLMKDNPRRPEGHLIFIYKFKRLFAAFTLVKNLVLPIIVSNNSIHFFSNTSGGT